MDLLRSLRSAGSALGPPPDSWDKAPPAVAVVCTARAVEVGGVGVGMSGVRMGGEGARMGRRPGLRGLG